MNACPQCNAELEQSRTEFGAMFGCKQCGGLMATMPVLRRVVRRETINAIWQAAGDADAPGPRPCPVCRRPMVQVVATPAPDAPTLDVCTRCQAVWFDAAEFDRVPLAPPPEPGRTDDKPLDPRAREAWAIAQLEERRKQAERAGGLGSVDEWPDRWWKALPMVLGLPVEADSGQSNRRPVATLSVAGLILLISVAALFGRLSLLNLALVPADLWRYGGVNLLSSFFVHAGWFHLASNLYFLLVFGDDVENALGPGRWLVLLLLATLLGDVLHIALDPRSAIPVVGASGGISGLLAFYALCFPRRRLQVMVRYFVMFRFVTIPAWLMFGIWVLLQLVGATLQVGGLSSVSSLAHLGGVVAGVAFWMAHRRRAVGRKADSRAG